MFDPTNELTFTVMQTAASKSANFNSATVVDLQQFVGQVAVIANIGTKTAGDADATLDIRLMGSAESNGANATNLNINFTQVTNVNVLVEAKAVEARCGYRYLKAVAVIGGTNSPAFPVGMVVAGVQQQQP